MGSPGIGLDRGTSLARPPTPSKLVVGGGPEVALVLRHRLNKIETLKKFNAHSQ